MYMTYSIHIYIYFFPDMSTVWDQKWRGRGLGPKMAPKRGGPPAC